MKKQLTGISFLEEEPIRYYMIEDSSDGEKDSYGILVEFREEQTIVTNLAPSGKGVQALLGRMRKGNVTPISVLDIVEDWLAGN